MGSTKTTLFLSNDLRARLKALAAARGKTMTDLLAEGAELVLARYQGKADLEELKRRGRQARERMRNGLYEGPGVSDVIDDILYASEESEEKGPRYPGRK